MEEHDTPARQQVKQPVTTLEESNDMMNYNIWSHRGYRPSRQRQEGKAIQLSQYRCHRDLDCGWTRGEKSGCTFICIYFARGICHHGSDCNFRHRVPDASFELHHRRQPQYDIFGRDRDAELVGTKGAGCLSRDCTTLYIYLGALASLPKEQVEEMLRDEFGEWGEIEEVNVVPRKAIGFVRFVFRSSAEFAKAAMHQQQLTGDANVTSTVLDVRWALDDPNPVAIERVKRKQEEALVRAYMEAIERLGPEEKRARIHDIELSRGYNPNAVTSSYPRTLNDAVVGDAEERVQVDDDDDDDDDEHRDGEEEDDVNRYLLPDDVLEDDEKDGDAPSTSQAQELLGQSLELEGLPTEDENALGLISGYGSD